MEKIADPIRSKSEISPDFKRKLVIGCLATVIILVAVYALRISGVRAVFYLERFRPVNVDLQDVPMKFSFLDRYGLDNDEKKKFGSDYVIGFKLPSDPQTGCDIRKTDSRLDMSKKDDQISAAVNKQLESASRDFVLLSQKTLLIDGEKSWKSDFTMSDPTGSTIRIEQILVSRGQEGYAIICGSQELLFERVSPDFGYFISSIRWR
jgi:hypothetical protein